MRIGQRALWLRGPVPKLCRVRVIHDLTIDVQFADRSERGHLPITEFQFQESDAPLPYEPSSSDAIAPKGIESGEEFGRF